jgi:hypothetical protein
MPTCDFYSSPAALRRSTICRPGGGTPARIPGMTTQHIVIVIVRPERFHPSADTT